ncbi:hypothetical protein [Mucilaginibacter flavidus]|uniref:hypothetical protein n=1 Tax=Mucilaginibacter flavidus TaxID=2949309 RepID=UPI002092550B|nr:hypothetical protein [Mucilaginibacter flavidus]MCO5949364.1 hypothetical protein [Mucilaginibacter flavidus]
MKKILLFIIILMPGFVSAQSYQVGKLKVEIEGTDAKFVRQVKIFKIAPGINELEVTLTGIKKAIPLPIIFHFKQPSVDIQSYLCPYGANEDSKTTSLYAYGISRLMFCS